MTNPNMPPDSTVDQTHRTFIDYIERTRAHYLSEGFGNPYAWAYFDEVPFTRLDRPVRDCRVGLITTAAEFDPAKGDQGPHAPYNNDAKFKRVYARPVDSEPDLRISHIGYDRANTVPADLNAYFPLAHLRAFAGEGRIGGLAARFYGLPTLRSQRATIERDGPEILAMCREDGVEVAVLPAV